ncbi:MAG: class I SAM-dependent methyltransferase [Clostridia bacterium]|nr:class I SAM-dependent methyltransferase [Clostridia bacterium]
MITNKFSEQQNDIMRTAFLTAYPKIFTDIDYSMEIFSLMKNLVTQKGFSFQPNQFTNAMALEIEARHKAINSELNQLIDKDTLVIEIAAGLSPRHLQYQSYDYIELDFKPVIEIKKSIYSDLFYERLNNTLFDVDLANIEQLHRCLITILKHNQHKKLLSSVKVYFGI